MKSINTFAVETVRGVRAFHLHQGDICDSTDNVIVASSHANPKYMLSGKVIEALARRYGCDFNDVEPLLVPRDLCGTYRLRQLLATGQTALLVRIPSAWSAEQEAEEPVEVLRHALWTLFGSLAALEFRGESIRSISLPVIAGRRDYPVQDLLRVILDGAIRWLRSSQGTESVSLYVYEPMDFSHWYEAMDRVLGRKYFDAAKNSILHGLRQELLSILKKADAVGDAGAQVWKEQLREALADDLLKFSAIALPGRKLAEFVAEQLVSRLALPAKKDLADNIKTIEQAKKVAPWAISYLNSLRTFGNLEAHSQASAGFQPRAVTQDDLLALICSIMRVVQVWLDWDSPSAEQIEPIAPEEPASESLT